MPASGIAKAAQPAPSILRVSQGWFRPRLQLDFSAAAEARLAARRELPGGSGLGPAVRFADLRGRLRHEGVVLKRPVLHWNGEIAGLDGFAARDRAWMAR